MNIASIVTGAFALAKVFPIIDKWLERFYNEWNSKRSNVSDNARETFKQEKKALDRAIEKAETDEDIKYLSITLRNLNNGELSDGENSGKIL